MSFIDRAGNLVQPTKEHYEAHKKNPAGTAYAFFYCAALQNKIESEIPNIRHMSQTPSELELVLCGEFIPQDENLLNIQQEARDANINYVMKATYPGATHKQTAPYSPRERCRQLLRESAATCHEDLWQS